MQGYLIIDTDEQGSVTTYEQYNMAVWTHLHNQILEQRPDLFLEHHESPDPSGRYCGIIKVFWRIAQLIERTTDNREVDGLSPSVPTNGRAVVKTQLILNVTVELPPSLS